MSTASYIPPQTPEQLVLAWLRRARESQMAHYEMANVLGNRARFLGVPVIVLASLIGASTLASVASEIVPTWSKLVVGLLSLAAAVLSSLQTFLGYSDRGEKHRTSAARFGSVRRKLEAVYAKREDGINQQLVDTLREELDALAQEALHVPAHVFRRVLRDIAYADGPDYDPDSNQAMQPAGPARG